MDDHERFIRTLDNLLDRRAEDVGYGVAEAILQRRAQDMRECAVECGHCETISHEDVSDWPVE